MVYYGCIVQANLPISAPSQAISQSGRCITRPFRSAVSNQARDHSQACQPVETTESSGLEDIGETLFDKGQATRERSDEHLDVPSRADPSHSPTHSQWSSFSIGQSSYLRSLLS